MQVISNNREESGLFIQILAHVFQNGDKGSVKKERSMQIACCKTNYLHTPFRFYWR